MKKASAKKAAGKKAAPKASKANQGKSKGKGKGTGKAKEADSESKSTEATPQSLSGQVGLIVVLILFCGLAVAIDCAGSVFRNRDGRRRF